MKVLFLTITAGYGHHSCGKAAIECLKKKGIECQMIDVLDENSHVLKETVSQGFLFTSKYTSGIYDGLYRFYELKNEPSPKLSISRMFSKLASKRIEDIILGYDPDVVICTHVYAAQVFTEMNMVNVKSIGIITDFTIHPYWEDTDLDYYVVAHKNLTYQFEKKGLDRKKILPFGIPISPKFTEEFSKDEARALLGMENKKTILIMSGSMGHGNVVKNIKKLCKMSEDFQIINVCGKNKRLYKKVGSIISDKKIYNYSWTDKINLLMSASDCIVTKPGGLTVSEALAKNLMIIISENFPGQEERNIEFLLNNGLAMRVTPTFTLQEAIISFFGNPSRLDTFVPLAKGFGNAQSASDFADFIEKNCSN